MELNSLNDFLVLDERKFDDFQSAFEYIKKYIADYQQNDFNPEKISDLEGLIDKFLQFGTPIKNEISGLSSQLLGSATKFLDYVHKYKTSGSSEMTFQKRYQDFYSNFLTAYNKISFFLRFNNPDNEYLNFDGLISYDICNKRTAKSLIEDAIELIKEDLNISQKSKDNILNYLTDAINELTNPKSNWNKIWSRMTEVIIVLGTLGAIISGVDAGHNLLAAKNKLEKAKDTIVKTSININYFNIEQTFVINQNIAIEDNKIILPEGTE